MSLTKLKVVVLSGGRGSLALQHGLRKHLRRNIGEFSIISIVNAYDDGKSTGVVRRLIPGGILGPSDVRKLQLAQYQDSGGDPAIIRLFDFRFQKHDVGALSSIRAFTAGERHPGELGSLLAAIPENVRSVVRDALQFIVSLPQFDHLRLDDFSFSNLVYAGLAGRNSNDLQAAEAIIRRELGVADPVLLNSRENLYLCGLTESGIFLPDESSIVDYSGPAPIYEIFLTPAPPDPSHIAEFNRFREFKEKHEYLQSRFADAPSLSLAARDAILEADLIVYSAGTQHSSLYPTYLTRGIADALCRSRAYKIMVTNIRHDNEIPHFRAADIVRQAVYYLNEKGRQSFEPRSLIDALIVNDPIGQESTLIRPNRTQLERLGIAEIRYANDLEDTSAGKLGCHNADRLASVVYETYLAGRTRISTACQVLTSGPIAFDLDDTLFVDRRRLLVEGRTGQALNVDATNVRLILELLAKGFRLGLISGNDNRVIQSNFIQELVAAASSTPNSLHGLVIYSDGATTKHRFSDSANSFVPAAEYGGAHQILPEHRVAIASILDDALRRLRTKYPTMADLYRQYDSHLFSYDALPTSHFVRGDYNQLVIKPIPSEWHSRSDAEIHDDRKEMVLYIEASLSARGLAESYAVLARGWGSIEVQRRAVDKFTALADFLSDCGAPLDHAIYFGNELDPRDGNDYPIAQRGACVIAVSREEGTLPPLPNVIYGGHRGTASTSLHLESMLEMFEGEMEKVRSGGGIPAAPVTILYMNRLLRKKLESEWARTSKDPATENALLKRSLTAAHELSSPPK